MGRLGLALNNRLPFSLRQAATQAAEEEGYEVCWVSEGYGGKETPSLLGALAMRTSTIRLGTGILTIYTRGAALMAQLAATLNEISGGRFVLGLGAGHEPDLWAEHGIHMERPFQRMREYAHVVREAMRNGQLSYEGHVVTVPQLKLPFPLQRPVPIYVAALGPKMAELAGEIGDGVLFNMGTVEYLEEAVAGVKEGARRAGRDPSEVDVACNVTACADGSSYGEMVCRRQIAIFLERPFYQAFLRHSGYGPDVDGVVAAAREGGLEKSARAVSDRMVDALSLAGDPATWWDKVVRFQKAGVKLVCPNFRPGGPDADLGLTLQGIRGLAKARRLFDRTDAVPFAGR